MAKKLHALMVAIDTYPNGVTLDNPYKRAQELQKFLSKRMNTDWSLHPKLLRNQAATRGNIIKEMEALANVDKDDVCLFYYAGHGSNEPRDHELRQMMPEPTLETIICVDSRTKKELLDLADKELAYLINRIVKKGIHFLAIMDCCNSGDNTRKEAYGLKISTMAANTQPRKLKEFYGYEQSKPHFPVHPKHVQMAACSPETQAHDGLFTQMLLEVLESKEATAFKTYQDVMTALKKKMKSYPNQIPELSKSGAELNTTIPFLKKAVLLGPAPKP